MFLWGSITVFFMSAYSAFYFQLASNGYFFEPRFLDSAESVSDFLPSSVSSFFNHLGISLIFGFIGLILLWCSHFVITVLIVFVTSPHGEGFLDDKKENIKEVLESDSRTIRFFFVFHHRGVRTPLAFALAGFLTLLLGVSISHNEENTAYKFYATNIEAPDTILGILDSNCDVNSALYTNTKIRCGMSELIDSEDPFFNDEDGKAIIVVWNDDLTDSKVVFRADSKYTPPTETVEEMTSQLKGHFHLANLSLAGKYESNFVTPEHRESWKALEL